MYLSSITGESSLNHRTMLHVFKGGTYYPTLVDVANDFVGRKKTESNFLENFSRTISQTSSLFRQSQHKQKIRDNNKRYCYIP